MNKSITSFESACAVENIDPNVLPDVSMIPEKYRQSLISYYKLMVSTDAYNGEWEPDYTPGNNQWKYDPLFIVKADKKTPSGSGLSLCAFSITGTRTRLPARGFAWKNPKE